MLGNFLHRSWEISSTPVAVGTGGAEKAHGRNPAIDVDENLVSQIAGDLFRHYRLGAPMVLEPRIFFNLIERDRHGKNPAPLGGSLNRLAVLRGLNG